MIGELNREIPWIPKELHVPDGNIVGHVIEELWEQVCDELLAAEHRGRSHNIATYDHGCRGPLCRKALREHPRRRSPSGVPHFIHEERSYDPILEYFYTVLKYRIKYYQHDLLKELAV